MLEVRIPGRRVVQLEISQVEPWVANGERPSVRRVTLNVAGGEFIIVTSEIRLSPKRASDFNVQFLDGLHVASMENASGKVVVFVVVTGNMPGQLGQGRVSCDGED